MTLDELVAVLESRAAVPSEDGGYSELDHGLQCAAELARLAPDDLELQLAGLVHDIGHAFGDDESHGRMGAAAVRPALGDRVARLVEGHVPAKRYLVTVEPGYASGLSAVSTVTLGHQGGELAAGELAAFRATPDWEAAVVLRRADDAAKVPGREVPGLTDWLPALRRAGR
ncbi:MAG: metal-dependent phosphohydrolase [Actinomycetia bacterium]|nr:metal-dependent phosphohydrolase [Actinomycetes bacterium]